MRIWHRVLALVLAGAFLCCAGAAKPKLAAPKVTALVCTVDPGDQPEVKVIAGPVARDHWLGGEDAKGLMHKGDRLTLYGLEQGVLGEVRLTTDGALESESDRGGAAEGVFYGAQFVISPAKRAAYAKVREPQEKESHFARRSLLAAWGRKGSNPRWVTGEVIPSTNRAYRKVIADWLAARGVPASVIAKVIVEQIVRADINADKRQEVFLSFHTPDAITFQGHDRATKSTFSYLLMRHLPRGARQLQTVVLGSDVNVVGWVDGFCDLDGDGRAEIIKGWSAYEAGGADLLRWIGGRFVTVSGRSWGA